LSLDEKLIRASNATSAPPRTQMAHRGICWPPEPEPEPEPEP
jgi:hypothetical protein